MCFRKVRAKARAVDRFLEFAIGSESAAYLVSNQLCESADSLEDVDDERLCIYSLDDDTWTLAVNFDKVRREKPAADAYRRVKTASREGTLIIDEIEIL